MKSKNKDFLDENVYSYIDSLCESSEEYKELSENLKDRLSELLESIEDEDCNQILSDIEKLHDYLVKLNSLSTNELTLIKNNGKKLIEKYAKHKEKISSLKSKKNELEEELANLNEQKEKVLTKIDELNEENYKLYQEKNNLELQISIKQKEEADKQKLDNEYLKEQVKSLNEMIQMLNNQISKSNEEINDLSNKNKEIFKINTQMKEEILCKDEILKMSTEKYCKLNDENESVKSMNRGLQTTIEELDTQCRNYQFLIKQLVEKVSKYEKKERKVSFHSITNEEEDKSEIINNVSDNESIIKKRRFGVDYTAQGINLNELLLDVSELSDHDEKKNESKSPPKLKKSKTDIKGISRFNSSKFLLDNSEIFLMTKKNSFLYELLFRSLDC
jgi:DNA repair exonuclease SbcCD ATPase subunit